MTRALRFCMLATFYPPLSFGGDAIQIERLAVALAERGHEVDGVGARVAELVVRHADARAAAPENHRGDDQQQQQERP